MGRSKIDGHFVGGIVTNGEVGIGRNASSNNVRCGCEIGGIGHGNESCNKGERRSASEGGGKDASLSGGVAFCDVGVGHVGGEVFSSLELRARNDASVIAVVQSDARCGGGVVVIEGELKAACCARAIARCGVVDGAVGGVCGGGGACDGEGGACDGGDGHDLVVNEDGISIGPKGGVEGAGAYGEGGIGRTDSRGADSAVGVEGANEGEALVGGGEGKGLSDVGVASGAKGAEVRFEAHFKSIGGVLLFCKGGENEVLTKRWIPAIEGLIKSGIDGGGIKGLVNRIAGIEGIVYVCLGRISKQATGVVKEVVEVGDDVVLEVETSFGSDPFGKKVGIDAIIGARFFGLESFMSSIEVDAGGIGGDIGEGGGGGLTGT